MTKAAETVGGVKYSDANLGDTKPWLTHKYINIITDTRVQSNNESTVS